MKPWAHKPSHSTRATPEWLKNAIPRFILTLKWPPKSPDAIPLNYWGILESKVGTKKFQRVDHLKKAPSR